MTLGRTKKQCRTYGLKNKTASA